MDCEVLINAVQERPAVWDIANKHHHNRHILDKLWDEIRRKVGSSKDKCRRKWKYLKDRFRTELRKERIFIRSGKSETYEFKTKFVYFHQMSFMRSQMWVGKTEDQFLDYPTLDQPDLEYDETNITNNLYDDGYREESPEGNGYVHSNINHRVAAVEAGTSAPPQTQTDDSRIPKLTLKVHRKVNRRKIAKRFLQIEERKAELLEKIEMERNQPKDSDDLLFFKSLLGFMDTFTPAQNLRVRNKIQAVIFEEINESASYYPINEKFHM
ncbi:unnamed protein product [Hermetia illucens]|uniref:MADF domain-containing protein n=2 Tax=Hermetia illucens TaxID=343691 RepID=A0A7R8UL53_HERIL|nr:unnamed protein product [Hermetia illucens]